MSAGEATTTSYSDEDLVNQLEWLIAEMKPRKIDIAAVLHQAGIPFTNPGDPIVNVHRKPARLVGNAYDINRVLQACQDALKHIEQHGLSVTENVTVYVSEPQNDEP